MNRFEVTLLEFDQLTSSQQANAPNNGHGKESASYLCVKRNGKHAFAISDAMEPEDARFTRDLKWVKEAIEYAYQCGISDGKPETAA